MVDGSAINVLSDTNSSSGCYVCGAPSAEMNTKFIRLSKKTIGSDYPPCTVGYDFLSAFSTFPIDFPLRNGKFGEKNSRKSLASIKAVNKVKSKVS
ncbi:hypothetical protein JTE90_018314 [Oedothorax gibbosus]|uniref:Uncharacterized protein n=1 Tax=Oedothorax gibbosus TaxID=931172 RepID=A0AAV6UGM3_9ARAC|nr:hypothetical protein JTE90_018314 [Oedothorax gibbosus]